jgi:5-methylcytosine-specific restriction endonuclease McrA
MDVEHIIPEAADGLTEESNLWLSCSKCNLHKADRTHVLDPQTREIVPLFNPRQQIWSEHFEWLQNGILISGKTAIGRVTVEALNLNRTVLVIARRKWVAAGWHPPKD